MLLTTLASASVLLTGCAVFIPDVHDLRLLDIQPVEYGTTGIEVFGEPAHPPNYVIGRIDIATQSDVVGIVDASGSTLWAELTICQSPVRVVDYGVSYKGLDLFDAGLNKEIRAQYLELAGAHNPTEPFTYQVYFDPRGMQTEMKAPQPRQSSLYEPVDLTREPRDLCLRIGGGNELGGSFGSNTVVVPSAVLKRAFNEFPK